MQNKAGHKRVLTWMAVIVSITGSIAGLTYFTLDGPAYAASENRPKASTGGVGVGLVKLATSNGNMGVGLVKLPK
jgi:hypothetical protein